MLRASRPAACTPAARARRRGRSPPRALVRWRGEEDGRAEAIGVLRAEAIDVVLMRDIHPARSELRVGKSGVHEVTALDRDHPSRRAVADEIDRDVREGDRDGLIERVRIATPKVVGELARDRLLARAFADLVGER